MSIESLKQKARKHEQNEEWKKALDQYNKALAELDREEQVDIGLYNRVGDLYVRVGDLDPAVEHYEKAVDLYREAYLPNNAIAVCKKIIRHVPSRHRAYLVIGQIRAEQGFIPDARTNFLTYAERMSEAGDLTESFRALIEFCDLAPDDIGVRLTVADQMAAKGMTAEAVEQLIIVRHHFERLGDHQQVEDLATRILHLDPEADLQAVPASSAAGGGDDMMGGFDDISFDDMGFGAATPDASLIVEEAAEEAASDPAPEIEIEAATDEVEVDPGLAGFEIQTGGDEVEVADPLPMMDGGTDFGGDDSDEAAVELPTMDFDDDSSEGAVELPTMDFDDDSSEGAVELPTMDFDDDSSEGAVELPTMDFDDDSSEGAVELPTMDFEDAGDAGELPMMEIDGGDAGDPGVGDALEHAFEETEPAEESLEDVSIEITSADEPETESADDSFEVVADTFPSEAPVESVAAPVEPAPPAEPVAAEPVAAEPPPAPEVVEPVPPPAPAPPPAPEPEAEAPAADEPDGGFVDLGAMILGDTEKKSTRFTVAYEEPSGDEEADFAKMLSQFKDKVSENLDSSDVRAHYDLGTAYKEMGLLDEAISSFQAALRASSDHLPTYELMGQTFIEMEQPEAAVRSLERAIDSANTVDDELVGIYYYLGRAYEELGNRESAVEYYDRVFSLDINFMDVTERLRELR